MAETQTLAELYGGGGRRYPGPEDYRDPVLGVPENPWALPARQPAEARPYNPERPRDAMAPVAEMISPTMGAYGMGSLGATAAMDARQGKYDPETLAPLAAMAFAPGPKRVPRIENPIRAYHGSPHDFNEFSLSKIGTGEGAQSYGHGLYFAENENVARSYKRDVGAALLKSLNPFKETPGRTVGGQPFDAYNPVHLAADYIDAFGLDGGIKQLERDIASRRDNTRGRYEQAMTLLRDSPNGLPTIQGPGKMYEVNLHATPEQFLDWDKPLSGQNTDVSGRLREVYGRGLGGTGLSPTMGKIFPKANRELSDVEGLMRGREGAPDALREAGIPGIRYLDQGSRGKGEGSSNYVVWTPEIIEILRKYGLVGAAALPPAVHGAFSDHDPLNPWRQ